MLKKTMTGCLLLMINASYGYTGLSVCHYENKTVDSVICYGPSVMNNTTVTGDIKVTGTLRAKKIKARNIQVDGNVEISESTISGTSKIGGALNANNVEFKQGVTVSSDTVMLNKSAIRGLLTIISGQAIPYVQVLCDSTITGSALFMGKSGIIQITDNSYFKGKVINGAMQFIRRECE